jgi:hypothetical protein
MEPSILPNTGGRQGTLKAVRWPPAPAALLPFRNNDVVGFSVVDLETGKRADVTYAPSVAIYFSAGVDMPQFVVSPDARQLITIGLGLDSKRYESQVKWQHRIPKMSLLSYDLTALPFVEQAPKLAARAEAANGAFGIDSSPLFDAATAGNLNEVRRLLDGGIDPNQRFGKCAGIRQCKSDDMMTALRAASAQSHLDVATLLLKRGADPRLKERQGRTALDFAKTPEMKRVLKEALKDKKK